MIYKLLLKSTWAL